MEPSSRSVDSPFLSWLLSQVPIISSLRPRDRSHVKMRVRTQHYMRTLGREVTEKQSRASAIVKGFMRRTLMNSITMGASSGFLQALNS